MSCSKAQWLDYTEGRLSARERLQMDEHIASCSECRGRRDDMLRADEQLRTAAGETREAYQGNEGSVARIWDGVRFRIRRALATGAEESVGLDQLRSILVSMFGAVTADGALKTAALRVNPEHRDHFASNLGVLVDVVCGDKAGRLVRHAARGIDEERVA